MNEPSGGGAWLVVAPGSSLKRCPRCGTSALEGEVECSVCGLAPTDDESWRVAGRAPTGPFPPLHEVQVGVNRCQRSMGGHDWEIVVQVPGTGVELKSGRYLPGPAERIAQEIRERLRAVPDGWSPASQGATVGSRQPR